MAGDVPGARQGFARAWRGRWDHPLFKSKQEAAVWAWMTDTARFRAHEFQTRFGIVRLERGQLLVSQRTIADEFGLGRQQVRRLIDSMVIAGMITEKSTHSASRAGTIVTIVNFERYQGDAEAGEVVKIPLLPKRQPITNPRPTQDQPTREEGKEGREGKEESPSDSVCAGALPAVDDVQSAFDAFQALRREIRPTGGAISLTAPRRAALGLRLREIGGIEAWGNVLARIRASRFLRGDTDRWGGAEIDWILKPANLTKIIEGNYDERPDRRGLGNGSGASPIDALAFARAAGGFD
ncbi:hypothetical protein [Sphingomonas sp. SRS2]|uniref:hypothetical protein n=1 Tax=Sphingomonas sp. SRS2 TaxID=133190 RepID=UPI0006184090|nr:hypothetical protein [Sphingomonas sp. SRS2]KKC27308.1 hypothetical protein WP12_03950 [Sphingomonas sp. SRS2]